tara:strand:- start:8496 stop:8972 length:477 start_codon:yes stop_codon:yes gene_type:complete
MNQVLTLGIVCDGERVLLGMKKRGFGEGRWNGFGGKVEEGETLEVALCREFEEEVCIVPQSYEEIGLLKFTFDSVPDILEVHIFKIDEFSGEPFETEEMRPKWFTHSEIPFSDMWSDDVYWFPYLLESKKFEGHFHFDRPADKNHEGKILGYEIEEIF